MAEKMKQYIEEQPVIWQRIAGNLEKYEQEAKSMLKGRSISRIVLIGSGSSINSALAAAPLFEELLGIETMTTVPTRMGICFPKPDSTLVIAISQSGKSTSTMNVVQKLKEEGHEVIAMTSDVQSPLAKACAVHILIDCGEETVGPKTKGMSSTILTLYMIAFALAKIMNKKNNTEIKGYISNIETSIGYAKENIDRCYKFCRKHVKRIASYPHSTWVSDGEGYAVAMESALKVLETLYVPAYCYEFEEYLHGVNNTIESEECYVWMPSTLENRERMVRLYTFCETKNCDCYMIVTQRISIQNEKILHLKGSGMPYTQPFETLLFAQVLSALGSKEKNIDCDKPKFPEFYKLMNTKL